MEKIEFKFDETKKNIVLETPDGSDNIALSEAQRMHRELGAAIVQALVSDLS